MAAKSPEQVLPVLPPEVLSMVVRSFRWNEDVANIHDTWTKLRSVCHLFKVIVDKDFLSSTVFQHAHLFCPCQIGSGPDVSFHRLSVDGETAIYRVEESDWYQVKHLDESGPSDTPDIAEEEKDKAELIEEIEDGDVVIYISCWGISLSTVTVDRVTMEILVPMRELWSCYFEIKYGITESYRNPW